MTALDEQPPTVPAPPAGTRLVQDDPTAPRLLVHRSTMTSEEVYRQELKNVFERCWLYVGHESEVARPGDYVRRPVGGRPLFMVRGVKSGEINVFHNT